MQPVNHWQQFHDREAPVYDQQPYTHNTIHEVDFLIEHLGLAPGQSILDLGCGTGRHAIELARRGYAVTGLDLSAGMLAQARAKALQADVQIEWIQDDATKFVLEPRFEAVICLCEGSFGLLTAADDPNEQPLAILRNVHHALKPGGRTLFTVLNGFKAIRQASQEDVGQGRFDPLTLSTLTDLAPEPDGAPLRLRERWFLPTELRLLFELAGLSVLHVWGGTAGSWNRQPIELEEFEIMIIAQKPVVN